MAKKKIVIHSNFCRVKTGFGKHAKHILSYLYKTNKYDIVEFANGRQWNDPALSTLPWKCIGSLPHDPKLINEINSDQQKARMAGYGHHTIDALIKEQKPDIYLGIEDIWGLNEFWSKLWWDKINSIIWTPIDSVPLLDKHVKAAKNTDNIIVQASFAHKALKKQGFNNSHLMPVPIDVSNFSRFSDEIRSKLRSSHKIDKKDFIVGFVFRNQLRKSVPNLLDGFSQFLQENPGSQGKLLLHTHWSEGWDIPRLLKEKDIDPNKVLTTYYCDKCKRYEIKPFTGQDLDCNLCGSKKSQQTSQINRGLSEDQLNEIYNLMDVYCHPFTSGGQEIPIQEAKLTGLVTLVTNYSCGEDYSSQDSGGLPLDWSEYREPGTQFIKASTCSKSIATQLSHVYNLPKKELLKIGKKAREFVIDFCSIESVCSKFESLIDSMDKTSWDFDFSYIKKNTNYPIPNISDHKLFIIDLYKNILLIDDPDSQESEGINNWVNRLSSDLTHEDAYKFFIKTAIEENQANNVIPFEEVLGKDDKGKRILFSMPGSSTDVLNSTCLLKYIKDKHPEHNIYFASQKENEEILFGNPYIYKFLNYDPVMDDAMWGEGNGPHEGFFDFVLMPHTNTSKSFNYIHGNKHTIDYNINYA